MGRRRWSAIAVTGDIDDAIGLDNIDQVHEHNADINIRGNLLRTTNLALRELDAATWYVRDALDTGVRSLRLDVLEANTLRARVAGTDLAIVTRDAAARKVEFSSHDGAAQVLCGIGIAGRMKFRFPDKAGVAVAGDFEYDPAGGAGFEGFIYDTVNGRIYWFGAGGVHHVNQTAGIEFGAEHHSCPICGQRFQVKDLIKMEVDHFKTDGSPHAVPVHERCT